MPNLATKAWFLASPTSWVVCKKLVEIIGPLVRYTTETFQTTRVATEAFRVARIIAETLRITRVVTETTQAGRVTTESAGDLNVGEDC